jgi:hypothetical protein
VLPSLARDSTQPVDDIVADLEVDPARDARSAVLSHAGAGDRFRACVQKEVDRTHGNG